MTWFNNDYRAVYDQLSTGNGLVPASLDNATTLVTRTTDSQALLDAAVADITPATYTDLTNMLTNANGGLSGLETHISTQVDNFTRYSSAARVARVVTNGGCSTIFGAMSGMVNTALGAIGSALDLLDPLVQDVIDGVSGAVAALDAATGGIISDISGAIGDIGSRIASEVAELASSISTALDLGNTMGMISEYLNDPCAQAIIEQSGSPELVSALEAIQ